jgi:hypothetical protein
MAVLVVAGCSDQIRHLGQDDLLPLPEGLTVVGESGEDCGNGREHYCSYTFVVQPSTAGSNSAMNAVGEHLHGRGWDLEPTDAGGLRACKDDEARDCVTVESFTAWKEIHDASSEWLTPLSAHDESAAVVVSFDVWGSGGLL